MYELTDAQANMLKDILKVIGQDEDLNAEFPKAIGMGQEAFDDEADAIFLALGNGRITVSP